MSENLQVNSFYKYLINNGYYFDKDLIENYLLSLKVKPFEILTGNSGTGKTKLAQLFAQYICNSLQESPHGSDGSCYHKIKVSTTARSWGFKKKDETTGHECGWSLSGEYFKNVLPLDSIIKNYEIEVGGIDYNAEIEFVPQLYYDKNNKRLIRYFKELYEKEEKQIEEDKINGISHKKQLVELGVDCNGISSVIHDDFNQTQDLILNMKIDSFIARNRVLLPWEIFGYVPFKKSVPCKIIASDITSNARFYPKFRLANHLNDDIKEHLENLKSNGHDSFELKIKDFKPTISNYEPKWDKLNVGFEDLDDYLELEEEIDDLKFNYQIVPVGANWTDNTNIVGYYNVITEDYQSTPAYELIKQAQDDPENPYFLILDEMNLSHVERYFADFLSAIESGEEIPLYGNNETLALPDNLFIIGTVNVDETTYMFSPKVLDRANTVEFDTITALEYMTSQSNDDDFKGDISYLQFPLIDSNISDLNIEDLKEILSKINSNESNLWDILANELTEFQNTLKDSSFDFGFRVINEILRFMVVAWRYENSPNEWNNWERYFDAQIKQKILPKLHGSEKAIGNVLTNLFNLCLKDKGNNEIPKNFEINKDNCRYYTSALKLQNMSKVLSDQRYVSFIN